MKTEINVEEIFKEVQKNGPDKLIETCNFILSDTTVGAAIRLICCDPPHQTLTNLLIKFKMDKMVLTDMLSMIAFGFEAGRLFGRSELIKELEDLKEER